MSKNQTQLKAQWQQARGRIKEAWGALTDDDMDKANGQWDQLVGTIRGRTGDTLANVESTLNGILDSLTPKDPK